MKPRGKESTIVMVIAVAIEVGLIVLFALRGDFESIEKRFNATQLWIVTAILFFVYILYVELRLKRAGETLVEEKIKTHTLVDSLPQAVALVGADNRIINANAEACRLLGVDPVASIGHDFAGLFDGDAASKLRGDSAGRFEFALREPARKLRLTIAPLRGGAGRLVIVEEPDRGTMKERAIATPPREVSALLSSLWKSVTDLEQDIPQMSDETRKRIGEALVRSRKCLNLFDHVDHLPDKLNREPVEVASIAREALDRSMPVARAKQVRTEVQMRGDSKANVDRTLLRRALDEIIFNAVSYSKPGGVVKIALEGGEREIGLSVTDSGIGIPEEEFAKIFDPGFVGSNQLPETRDGRGMGLAVARRVVERHGGTVWVESRVGQGTRISLSLPRA